MLCYVFLHTLALERSTAFITRPSVCLKHPPHATVFRFSILLVLIACKFIYLHVHESSIDFRCFVLFYYLSKNIGYQRKRNVML